MITISESAQKDQEKESEEEKQTEEDKEENEEDSDYLDFIFGRDWTKIKRGGFG